MCSSVTCTSPILWRDLFAKLRNDGYTGYTLAEIPGSPDAERILRYYRALWDAYRSQPGA